jgi:hypothetical protein
MNGKMTLGELIEWLKQQDQDLIVKDGFSTPHSYRGYYEELAFTHEPEAKIADMLKYANEAMNKTFGGWKDVNGEYKMTKITPVHIANRGELGEYITTTSFKHWLLTGHK